MPRKKQDTDSTSENSVQKEIDAIEISGEIGSQTITGVRKVRGINITLNQKSETFFGVGSIWLTPDNFTAKVPDTLSPADERIIAAALRAGTIVEGDHYIPPIDKDPSVLDEYWDLVKTFGLSTKERDKKSLSLPAFRKLFKNGIDRNWTAKEIANYCIDREVKYKNRDEVLKLLQDVRRYSDCPDTLLESK